MYATVCFTQMVKMCGNSFKVEIKPTFEPLLAFHIVDFDFPIQCIEKKSKPTFQLSFSKFILFVLSFLWEMNRKLQVYLIWVVYTSDNKQCICVSYVFL